MISILLPVYNGEKYLKKSIDSVLDQTFRDFELIIGFNGTKDSSKEVVSMFNDSRIIVVDYGEESGKAKTLNKMLKVANFNWIALQDDDDMWISNKLEKQIAFTETHDVIGTQLSYINEDDVIFKTVDVSLDHASIVGRSKSGDNQMINTSSIFRKSSALKIDGWKENLDGIEDFDFWLRLMDSGNRFININERLVNHRIHNSSNFNGREYDIKSIL